MRLPCTTTCDPVSDSGFSKHRVHVGMRLQSACQRLQRLRAANLAAIRRHGCIVRHILRFERRDGQPAQRLAARHRPATSSDLPTLEPAPWIIRAVIAGVRRWHGLRIRKPPAGVFSSSMKAKSWRSASGRLHGGGAALSHWAVIGAPPVPHILCATKRLTLRCFHTGENTPGVWGLAPNLALQTARRVKTPPPAAP